MTCYLDISPAAPLDASDKCRTGTGSWHKHDERLDSGDRTLLQNAVHPMRTQRARSTGRITRESGDDGLRDSYASQPPRLQHLQPLTPTGRRSSSARAQSFSNEVDSA
jgi:hypothetical protein